MTRGRETDVFINKNLTMRAGKALPDRAGADFGRHGPAETERGGRGDVIPSERSERGSIYIEYTGALEAAVWVSK